MRLKGLVVLIVLVAVLAVGIVRWQQLKRYSDEELDTSSSKQELATEPQDTGGYAPPNGEYWLTVALDRSGSIPPEDREIEDQIVKAVGDTVEGRNILQVVAFANTYETFGASDTEQGRAEMLSRWQKSVQYDEDRKYTNLTVTADNLVRDAVPNIEAGRLAEVIIITDGDHDPLPGQNDNEIIASVRSNLDAIPEQYRDRLRVHVIEVGDSFQFSGWVETNLFQGRAKTLRTSSWDEVLPIVQRLQADLLGSFSLDMPWDRVEIGAPSVDKPKVVGSCDFKLVGPESAKVRFELISDSPDAGQQLISSVRVNLGPWVPLPTELQLKDKDRLEFSFYENPNETLPNFWLSDLKREYKVTVEAGNNLMALQNESSKLYVQVSREGLVWRWWWAELLTVFLLFVLLVRRILTVRRRNLEEEEAEPEQEDEGSTIQVQYQGQIHVLAPPETRVGRIAFVFDRGGVLIRPDCQVLVEYHDRVTYSRRRFQVSTGETFSLPDTGEAVIKDPANNRYQVTRTITHPEVIV